MAKPKKTKKAAAKGNIGLSRNWQIQTDPHEALAALILRYLSPKRATAFNRLLLMVWDDLCECIFWTRRETGDQDAKVFVHGLGSAMMDRRRQVVREDMQSALVALLKEGTIVHGSGTSYRLRTVEARADWLEARPPALLRAYRGLRMTHDGWESARAGLDRFDGDGALKDARDEEIRQLKLENARLRIDLVEARALLKTYQEASAKRRALR